MNPTLKILVLGGGITGLTAAYRLKTRGHTVELLEAAARPGGVIRSKKENGFLAEYGPNTMQETHPEVADLLREIGLENERVAAASPSRKRFVLRDGRPVALPLSPVSLLFGGFFGLKARLRLLREPFVPPAEENARETIADFVRRRLGEEVLDYAVNPFVAGTFAGKPETLAIRYAFPRLHEMERSYGSLVKAAFAGSGKKDGRRARRDIFSFQNGLQTLPDRLTEKLGDTVHTATKATELSRENGRWRVSASRGDRLREFEANAVVLALPAVALDALTLNGERLEKALSAQARLPHFPVVSLVLGFRRQQVRDPLDGFGILVPEKERRRILGVLFSSSIFPGRAPDGCVTLTVFVGGSRQPELAGLPKDEIEALVRDELSDLLGAEGEPVFSRQTRWSGPIPQYPVDHDSLLADLDALEERNPGLRIGGPVRQGVSIGDCILSGLRLADGS